MVAPPDVEAVATAVVGGAGATGVTVDVSALGIADPDLVLAVVSWRAQGTVSATEDGWTELGQATQLNGPTMALFARQGADEHTTFEFTITGSASRVCAAVARIPDAAEGVDAAAVAAGSSTTPTAPTSLSGGGDRLVLRAWSRLQLDVMTGLPPDGYTTEWQLSSGGAAGGVIDQVVASAPVAAGGPVGTSSVTIAAARNWCGATVIVQRVPGEAGRTDWSLVLTLSRRRDRAHLDELLTARA
jgi:hypothetical protein